MGKKNSKQGSAKVGPWSIVMESMQPKKDLEDEDFLEKDPILKTMKFRKKVSSLLKVQDIKAQHLKHIFLKETPLVQYFSSSKIDRKLFQEMREKLSNTDFEHEVIMGFWFSVHTENLELTQYFMSLNPYVKQLVTLALMKKREKEETPKKREPSSIFQDSNRLTDKNKIVIESEDVEDEKEEEKQDDGTWRSHLLEESKSISEGAPDFEGGESEEEEKKVESEQSAHDNNLGQSDLKELIHERQSLLSQKIEADEEDEEEQEAEFRSIDGINERNEEHLRFLQKEGIDQEDVEGVLIDSKEKLILVKNILRSKFQKLLTNILRLLLIKGEERLGCQLTAFYEVQVSEDMIVKGVLFRQLTWLQFVWAFTKNFIEGQKENTFVTYIQLFDIMKSHLSTTQEIKEEIKSVCEWMLLSHDNILVALLYHYHDDLALEYMGFYSTFLDRDLFLYSLNHGNKMFLQYSLQKGAYDKIIFRDEEVITQMLVILKDGCRTNFSLNVLLLVDITMWKNKFLKEMIEVFSDYVDNSYDQNALILTSNPLMTIALTCEILKKIASFKKRFYNESNKLMKELLTLGKMLISKIEDEKYYEMLILDTDFRGRSILKIITINEFEPLMNEGDPKAENLILNIWYGREATKCDGNIYGYSNLAHILSTKSKKVSSKKTSFFQMISNDFEPKFDNDYKFQYRYRVKSISFYFQKEIFWAFAMLCYFQYLNFIYMQDFKGIPNYLETYYNETSGKNESVLINFDPDSSTYDFSSVTFHGDPDDEGYRLKTLSERLSSYVNYDMYTIIFATSLLFALSLKVIFNIFATVKVPMDKWIKVDSICGTLSLNLVGMAKIISVLVMSGQTAETLNDPLAKEKLNYFMSFVIIVDWMRIFTFLLIIQSVSKIMLTLYEMLYDTLSFIFIFICYLIIVGSIFSTLYQDVNPDNYRGVFMAMRTLYDALLCVYSYTGQKNKEYDFSVLFELHMYFANVIIINFLVAILSSTYEKMTQSAIFKYKVNLFQYCEKYMIALENTSIGELIIHAPPLCYLVAPMVLFAGFDNASRPITKSFSYVMFWFENIVLFALFSVVELVLMPVVFVKIFYNIMTCSYGLFTTIFYCFVWLICGLAFCFFLVLRDIFYLLKILSMHQGCRSAQNLDDELKDQVIDRDLQIRVYNEVRETVIEIYLDLRHKQTQLKQLDGGDEYDHYLSHLADLDILALFEEDEGKFSLDSFIVKESVICDEWKKRRVRLDFQLEAQRRNSSTSSKKPIVKQSSDLSSVRKKNASNREKGEVRKQELISDLVGNKKGGISQAIVEAMFQRPNKVEEGEAEQEVDAGMEVSNLEEKVVERFLSNFIIVSESSSTNDRINIILMLKALPNVIVDYNLDQMLQFNFSIFQDSLIAFQNLDIVNAFEYLDEKNRDRVLVVKEMLVKQKSSLSQINEIIAHIKNKVKKNEKIFKTYSKMELSNREKQNNAFKNAEKSGRATAPLSKKKKVVADSESEKEPSSNIDSSNKESAGGQLNLLNL